jgi:DNA-binding NarL/FixJ family response regulator
MVSAKEKSPDLSVKSRVILVEDHPVVRHGLAALIDDEPDLAICGLAESGGDALKLISQMKPDVVIIDIALGHESGLELIRQVHETWSSMPILALSMHDEALYAERALRAGAMGYIMKKEAMDKVMNAIRRVLAGDIYISERMASRMVHKLIDRPGGKPGSPLEQLSDREFEVFNLIAQSIGPKEIAQRLSLSVKTIETHREHIKEKLGLKSGAELTRFALEWSMQRR